MENPDAVDEYVVSVDIGCQPSPSWSAETIVQTEDLTLVVFRAIATKLSAKGFYDNLGFAVVECVRCSLTKFGYPNDEGLPEHSLYSHGLSDANAISEVVNSSWSAALGDQKTASARRIFGDRYNKAYNLAEGEVRIYGWKHFIFQFKENTFECIADSLKLHSVNLSFQEAMAFVHQQINVESAE